MFPGDSLPKRAARSAHWDLARDVCAGKFSEPHIGFAGPECSDIVEAWHQEVWPVWLYERDPRSFAAAEHAWHTLHEKHCQAQRNWYQLIHGDVREISNFVASAYLDFCGPLSPETTDVIKTIAPKVVSGGILTVTVLAGRETDTFERWLENRNRVAGTFGARVLALYELLPHPPKEWFAPVIAIGYVGHKVPMLQVSFRREKRPSSPARRARMIQVLHQL